MSHCCQFHSYAITLKRYKPKSLPGALYFPIHSTFSLEFYLGHLLGIRSGVEDMIFGGKGKVRSIDFHIVLCNLQTVGCLLMLILITFGVIVSVGVHSVAFGQVLHALEHGPHLLLLLLYSEAIYGQRYDRQNDCHDVNSVLEICPGRKP
jgi:hypothetical protein